MAGFADKEVLGAVADCDKYTVNASVLAAMGRLYRRGIKNWDEVCREANDFRAVVSHSLPNNSRQLKKLLTALQTQGAKGIVSGNYGNQKALKVTPDIERFICALFADCHSKPTKEETARRYGAFLRGGNLTALMDLIEGRAITARWLDGNNGGVLKAYAYDFQGNFLCEIVEKPVYFRTRLERTKDDEAKIEQMNAYTAAIEGYGRRRRKELAPLTLIDGRKHIIGGTFRIMGYNPEPQAQSSYLEREMEEKRAEILEDAFAWAQFGRPHAGTQVEHGSHRCF